jgi:citrate lyase subunit beta/citryl-CoA lyase
MSVYRTFLFAPGNHARRVEKALALDADAVILDLEDAVANAEKVATRPLVVAALKKPGRRCLGYIRVNAVSTPYCLGDVMAVVQSGVDGIVLPKVEVPHELQTIDWLVGELERERGLPMGGIDIIPIIETAKGLNALDAILRAGTRAKRVAFGAGDFTLDLGIEWTRAEDELAPYRAAIVSASRAAGLEPPIDTVWTRLDDPQGFEASTHLVKRIGFQGKMCIYPPQVPVANAIFAPQPEEVARARRIVAAFEEAERAGLASIQVDGAFVDYPIVYRARRLIEMAARIAAKAD